MTNRPKSPPKQDGEIQTGAALATVDENSVAFTAYNQAIEDAKAAIRGETVDDPYAAPTFINAIARKCSPHVYVNRLAAATAAPQQSDAETFVRQWVATLQDESHVTDEDVEDLVLRIIAYKTTTAAPVEQSDEKIETAAEWSKEWPTEDGWYWMRGFRFNRPIPVEIEGDSLSVMFVAPYKRAKVEGLAEFRGPIAP